MKKIMGIVLAAIMCLSMGAMMTGCKTDGEKTNGKIIVSTMLGAGDGNNSTFVKYNNAFTDKYGVKVEDRSGTAEGDWVTQVKNDLKSVNNVPDVIFHTSGAALDDVRDKLVTVADIRKVYPNFCNDIIVNDEDPASIEMKAGMQAIMYNTDAYAAADFADIGTLMTKVKAAKDTNLSATLPHYWFNHLMVEYLGITEYKAFDGKKAYFTPEKTALWENALIKVVADLRAMGSGEGDGGNKTPDADFWAGTNKLMLDGSWTAGTYATATAKAKIKFSLFPKASLTADGTKDTNFYIGGATNGWYITKQAWTDTAKRQSVIDYVALMSSPAAINEFCLTGGGLAANGNTITNADGTALAAPAFMDGLIGAATPLIAIDDRISADAKNAFLSTWKTDSGLPKILYQADAPTDADVKALLANAFIKNLG